MSTHAKPSSQDARGTPAAEPVQGYDPVALAESLAKAAEKGAKLMGEFAKRQSASGKTLLADELGIGKAFLELASKMMSNPMRVAESQMTLWWNYMSLWQSSLMRMMGAPTPPCPNRTRATSASSTRTGSSTSCSTSSSSRTCSPRAGCTSRWRASRASTTRPSARSTSSPASTSTPSRRPTSRSPTRRCSARRSPRAGRTWCAACTTCSTTSSAATAS